VHVKGLGVVALAVTLVTLSASCGGGGEANPTPSDVEADPSDVEEVLASALRAVAPAGEIGHLEVTEENLLGGKAWIQEIWLDADNERFRWEERLAEGDEPLLSVTVGERWRVADYTAAELSPPVFAYAVERDEWTSRGIDNFAYFGAEHLRYLAEAQKRRLIGETLANGRETVTLQGELVRDWMPETVIVMTMDLDKATLLPVELRQKHVESDGTQMETDVLRFQWDAVSPDELSPGFFSPDALLAAQSPVHKTLAEMSELGFNLYWLGEKYEDPKGQLDLYLWNVQDEWDVDDVARWPRLVYASETLGLTVVTIREGPANRAQFEPRVEVTGPWIVPGPGGAPVELYPETQEEQVTVQGQPATLNTARLSATNEVTHRWLAVILGETIIELHVEEEGPFESKEAILALAEDLAPVPQEQ
jgi:hypothetical protein